MRLRSAHWLLTLVSILSLQAWGLPRVSPPLAKGTTVPLTTSALPASVSNGLKSFKDWKIEKVQAATVQVEQTIVQLRGLKARLGEKNHAVVNMEQQLSQEQWNLEVAVDLSVTDYLVLYLAQHGTQARLAEAARKLSPEETAQILEAYIRSMGAFPSEPKGLLPVSAYLGK